MWELEVRRCIIPYSGKFSREKLSRISRFCGYSQKYSPKYLGPWCLLVAPASNPWKFSPQKSFFRQFAKVFSHESFPLVVMIFTTIYPLQDIYIAQKLWFDFIWCTVQRVSRVHELLCVHGHTDIYDQLSDLFPEAFAVSSILVISSVPVVKRGRSRVAVHTTHQEMNWWGQTWSRLHP